MSDKIVYDEWHPAPGRIVQYWPEGQRADRIPQAAIVTDPGFGYGGSFLMVLSKSGFEFIGPCTYGGEFPPAGEGEWTWPEVSKR